MKFSNKFFELFYKFPFYKNLYFKYMNEIENNPKSYILNT
jgi:hypothetical protein